MSEQSFKININQQVYTVTPVNANTRTEYTIETGCDYMFTLLQSNGEWHIKETDVKPFNEELIYNIGREIEVSE